MQIVRKAHALQASEIEIALYEGAKNLVQTWPTKSNRDGVDLGDGKGYDKDKEDTTENENASATNKSVRIPASGSGSGLGSGEGRKVGEISETSEESDGRKVVEAWKGRVGPFEAFEPLALAVVQVEPDRQEQPERVRKTRADLAVELAEHDLKSPAALTTILDGWLKVERSRSLREMIERARLVNERPATH